MIYIGKTANYILHQILEDRKSNVCKGYFHEDDMWIAFDNSNGNCWVEEFHTEEKALCWLENFFEISETNSFEVFKINNELILIPNNGYLTIMFENDLVIPKFYPLSA